MDPLTIVMALAQFAPSLIKWATKSEVAGDVADKALTVANAITGKGTLNESVEMFKQDPSMALQFKQAMLQQDVDFEKLYIDDKKDARARDTILSATPHGNVRANWLVGIAVIVVFTILGIVVFVPQLDEYAKGVLTGILGMYIQQLANIYAFEFGTTRRSREKTDVIDKMNS